MLTLTVLLGDGGPGGQPDPSAVEQMLAAGAVPALLRLMATPHGPKEVKNLGYPLEDHDNEDEREEEAAIAAFKPLRLMACDPRGEAAIAAADCAGPLVAALGAAFNLPLPDGDDASHDASTRDVRSDVVAVIGKLIEGRPGLGRAFLAAGIVREVGTFLGPARAGTERNLAMQLAEKLLKCVPGACNVMRAEGVFAKIHQLTLPAAPASGKPGSHRDVGTGKGNTVPLRSRGSLRDEGAGEGAGEGRLPLKSMSGFSEAEAAQATALLCLAACHCGGVLEVGKNTDGVSIRYTGNSVTVSNPVPREDARPAATSGPRPSRKVCSMCGAASEKPLQVCTRCRGARYCGRTCQAAHWPVHKRECRG